MKNKIRAKITALGTFVPPRILSNDDLEKMVATTNEWILERTGIRERHIVDAGMAASDLAVGAAQDLAARHNVDLSTVEAIIVGTVTPDMMYPSTACLVQKKLAIPQAWGFDISAGCSGFVYSLTLGAKLVESGAHKKVLVIGADVNSSMIDYTDRATCILFGDGAGAVLLEPAEDGEDLGFIDFVHQVEGFGGDYLYQPGGGSLHPLTARDGGPENALCSPGWAAGLQVRGEENGGSDRTRAGQDRADRARTWTASSLTRRTSGLLRRRRTG